MKENYCYIDDVLEKRGKGSFTVEKYQYKNDNLDPDQHSTKLYCDLANVFRCKCQSENVNGLNFRYTGTTELLDSQSRSYGSDYIGPSWNWAKTEFHFTDIEIAQGLKETRVLGGHMIWLRKQKSINTEKGSRGIYDRFDLCLDEIRDSYLTDFSKNAIHKNSLREAICDDREWFEIFGKGIEGFQTFVKCFFLNDFVTEKFDVISLAISDCNAQNFLCIEEEDNRIKESVKNGCKINTQNNCYLPGKQFGLELSDEERKNAYKKYIENCVYMIKQRNKKMVDFLEKK